MGVKMHVVTLIKDIHPNFDLTTTLILWHLFHECASDNVIHNRLYFLLILAIVTHFSS